MSLNKIVYLLLLLRNQTKIYHWQTQYYSRHKASDELVDHLDELIDKFVETYQGIYKNIILDNRGTNNISFVLQNIEDNEIQTFVTTIRKSFIEEINGITDSELLNIKDEILHVIDKTLYLFKLK
jgi:DNA-binding ferritin-like protein